MSHQMILITIFSAALSFALFKLIKNRPQYLVLLGIRGLLSCLLIRFINYLCVSADLALLISPNLLSLGIGSFLGFPGILLMYLSRLYFC